MLFPKSAHPSNHKILLTIGGVDIPILYDTRVVVTCMTLATFNKHFSSAKRQNHFTGVCDNHLGLYLFYTLPIKYKNKTVCGWFEICDNFDVDLLRINIIKELGIF